MQRDEAEGTQKAMLASILEIKTFDMIRAQDKSTEKKSKKPNRQKNIQNTRKCIYICTTLTPRQYLSFGQMYQL